MKKTNIFLRLQVSCGSRPFPGSARWSFFLLFFFRLFLVAAHKNFIVTQFVQLERERIQTHREQIASDIFRYLDVRRVQRERARGVTQVPVCFAVIPTNIRKRSREKHSAKRRKKKRRKQFLHASHVPCIPGLQWYIFLLLLLLFLFLLLLSILISHRHLTAQCNIVAHSARNSGATAAVGPDWSRRAAPHPRVKVAAPALLMHNEGIIWIISFSTLKYIISAQREEKKKSLFPVPSARHPLHILNISFHAFEPGVQIKISSDSAGFKAV